MSKERKEKWYTSVPSILIIGFITLGFGGILLSIFRKRNKYKVFSLGISSFWMIICIGMIVSSNTNNNGNIKEQNVISKAIIPVTEEAEKVTEVPKVTEKSTSTSKPIITASISSEKPAPTEDIKLSKYKKYLDNLGVDYSDYTEEAEIEVIYNDVKEYVDSFNLSFKEIKEILETEGFDLKGLSKYDIYVSYGEYLTEDTNNYYDFTTDKEGLVNLIRSNPSINCKVKVSGTVYLQDYVCIHGYEPLRVKFLNLNSNNVILDGDKVIIIGDCRYNGFDVIIDNPEIVSIN